MNKLNLGCGDDVREGYINIDVRKRKGVDIVRDVTKTLPFKDKSCDEVLAQDILEHLIPQDQEKLLLEINRILVNNGKLVVRTPNIEAIWEQMADDPETRNLFLYGETTEQNIWGVHKVGHTLLSLGTLFRLCGFKIKYYKIDNTNWLFELMKEKSGKTEVLVTNKISDLIRNMNKRPVVWKINEKIINYLKYRLLKYFVDEFWVPDRSIYQSLFPRTKIPLSRVKINQLEYQIKRSYARKLAKYDFGF